jgi:nucleoid DNA-binding protein
MKLKELNEQIAKACSLTPKQVVAVHAETFRLITEALDKGERVAIADFGVFSVKDIEATADQPAKKMVRFRQRGSEDSGEDGETKDAAKEEKKREKRAKKEAAAAETVPAEAGE